MHQNRQSRNWNHTHYFVRPHTTHSMRRITITPPCCVMTISTTRYTTQGRHIASILLCVFALSRSTASPFLRSTTGVQNTTLHWTGLPTMPTYVLNEESPTTTAVFRPNNCHSTLTTDLTDLQNTAVFSKIHRILRHFSQPTARPATKCANMHRDVCISYIKPWYCSKNRRQHKQKSQLGQLLYCNTMTLPLASNDRGHVVSIRVPSLSIICMD